MTALLREKLEKEVEAIRIAHHGILHEADLVKAGANPKSALHSYFKWDDGECAKLYRLEQARQLIKSISVTITDSGGAPIDVRAYVNLSSERFTGGGHRAFVEVMKDEQLRQDLLADAMKELHSFKMKYQHLVELRPIFEAIQKMAPASRKRKVA